jgi:hypothetical protein
MTRASLLVVVLLASPPAHAQSAAEAEVLFRTGRELIKQGRLAEGCEKLEASQQLESSVGTLLNLGDCREKLGMVASAWAAFRKAEGMAKRARDDKRQAEAGRRATALEPRIPKLVIEVKQPVTGLVIRRNGEIVDPSTWNTAIPVDPQRIAIVAEAPDFIAWRTEVVIDAQAAQRAVAVPRLVHIPMEPPPALPVTSGLPAPTVGVEKSRSPVYRSRTWSTTRELAAGLGLVAVGGVGVGAYFGARSRDLQDRADVRCPSSTCADSQGLRLNDEARTAARNANLMFAASGAALAVGVVMWLVGKPDDELVVGATAGEHQAGVSLRGRF